MLFLENNNEAYKAQQMHNLGINSARCVFCNACSLMIFDLFYASCYSVFTVMFKQFSPKKVCDQ